MASIKGVIFDFDGLILDTETADYISWKETYEAYGVTLGLAGWQTHIGTTTFDPYAALEMQLGRAVDRQALHARRKRRDNELLAQETILPGVLDYLDEAQALGLKIGLASSSAHKWVDHHLARLGLIDRFETICCQDDVQNRPKPDPAVYRLALQRLQVAPAEAVALEDSPHGIAAAKGAGLWCTAVPNQMTKSLDLSQADLQIETMSAMPLTQLITEVTGA